MAVLAAAVAAAATTVASTAATAFTAATTAIGSMSTLSALSLGATIFSGLSSIAQGNAQAEQYKIEASNKEAEARTAEINAMRQKNDATDQLLDTLAKQRVALAGDGSDLSAGVRTQIFGDTLKRADFSRQESDLDAAITARAARLSSRGLMSAASGARAGGYINALSGIGNWAMAGANRG
jgi:hypothetical protein